MTEITRVSRVTVVKTIYYEGDELMMTLRSREWKSSNSGWGPNVASLRFGRSKQGPVEVHEQFL